MCHFEVRTKHVWVVLTIISIVWRLAGCFVQNQFCLDAAMIDGVCYGIIFYVALWALSSLYIAFDS
jgi:hypothetical protein